MSKSTPNVVNSKNLFHRSSVNLIKNSLVFAFDISLFLILKALACSLSERQFPNFKNWLMLQRNRYSSKLTIEAA